MKSPNTSSAVRNQRKRDGNVVDDFPTPPWATRALIRELSIGLDLSRLDCWEPACGRGHMACTLMESFRGVTASDAYTYGYGECLNFFAPTAIPCDWIITNPPFILAERFIKKSLSVAEKGVAMLLRSQFFEGVGRYDRLFSVNPPTFIYQFVERVPMFKGRISSKGSTATSYAWFVWINAQARYETCFRWIAPCRKSLERPGDYVQFPRLSAYRMGSEAARKVKLVS